jgi:hypothetical protein
LLLDAVSVSADGTVYAAGEADNTAPGGQPLTLVDSDGTWQQASIPAARHPGRSQPALRHTPRG